MSEAPKQQPQDPGAEEQRRRLLSRFANHLRKLEGELTQLKQDLEEEGYRSETLRAFARRFQELSEEFDNYLGNQTSQFYTALLRSAERPEFARQIRDSAGVLAKQFEDYARRPDEYSWTNTRTLLNKVAIPVGNLRNACAAAAKGLG